jgi:hypothetical protein
MFHLFRFGSAMRCHGHNRRFENVVLEYDETMLHAWLEDEKVLDHSVLGDMDIGHDRLRPAHKLPLRALPAFDLQHIASVPLPVDQVRTELADRLPEAAETTLIHPGANSLLTFCAPLGGSLIE